MRLLVLAFFSAILATPCLAQAPGYLNDQAVFAKGWSGLVERIGANADVAEIVIRPDAIEVLARAAAGGGRVDRWQVSYRTVLRFPLPFHSISGPRPEQPSSPVRNIESGFFPLSGVPLDRLWAILDSAKARVRLDDPPRIASLRIARTVSLLPNPAHGEVRWTIAVASDRETAGVTTAADGRIIGVDISGTNRGRNKDFHLQDEWPFADAQASFRSIVGAKAEIYEIDVSKTTIAMRSVSRESPTAVTSWQWDGGLFTKGLVDSHNVDLIRSNGNLPFSLDEVDVAKIPAVLKAAREKEPTGNPRIMIARAVKERVAVGAPRVLWEVQLVDSRRQIPLFGEDFSERTIVKVTASGEVVSVLLPKSMRPAISWHSADVVLSSLAAFRTAYGGNARAFDLHFSDSRAHLKMASPATRATFEVELVETGLKETSSTSLAALNLKASFALDDLAKLDKASIEAMLAKARAEVPLAGSRVHGIRFWSGEPFWRPRQGMPYVDIRVGVPPRFDDGGYVVFTADGRHVETVK